MILQETDYELEFVRGLGTFSIAGQRTDRAVLLRRYIEAAERRKDWGSIDPKAVVDFAAAELASGMGPWKRKICG